VVLLKSSFYSRSPHNDCDVIAIHCLSMNEHQSRNFVIPSVDAALAGIQVSPRENQGKVMKEKKDHVGSERKLSASLPFDEDAFGGRRRQRRGIIQREIDSIVIKTSDEGESLGGDDDWSMMSSTVPRLKRAASIAELFKELQLETERNADYMKSPSNRSSGNMGAASAPPPSHKDSSPAA